jgi:hypothetical protein
MKRTLGNPTWTSVATPRKASAQMPTALGFLLLLLLLPFALAMALLLWSLVLDFSTTVALLAL